MKILVLIASLIATTYNISAAFAAPKNEVIKATSLLRVYPILCITQVGSNRSYTQLGDENSISVITHAVPEGTVELRHKHAGVAGCDLEKLKVIDDRSRMSFGFIHNAPTTVTKITSASYKYQGKCFANYREEVVADIGEGILVKSVEIEQREATDCAD